MFTLAHAPKPTHSVVSETVEGQTILLNTKNGAYFSLNSTGSFLWERLDGRTTLGDIASALATLCEVDTSITEPDVIDLATELWRERLIVPA